MTPAAKSPARLVNDKTSFVPGRNAGRLAEWLVKFPVDVPAEFTETHDTTPVFQVNVACTLRIKVDKPPAQFL